MEGVGSDKSVLSFNLYVNFSAQRRRGIKDYTFSFAIISDLLLNFGYLFATRTE